jgi:hypothetical protein
MMVALVMSVSFSPDGENCEAEVVRLSVVEFEVRLTEVDGIVVVSELNIELGRGSMTTAAVITNAAITTAAPKTRNRLLLF